MKLFAEHNGTRYRVDLSAGVSIAIPMDFAGPQPNHFGSERASAVTVTAGDFVGDTRRGGGCNVSTLTLTPHCNGTHTESVGHIVDEPVPIGDLAMECWCMALLVSVAIVEGKDTRESYRPPLNGRDRVITRSGLVSATRDLQTSNIAALVVRTVPNEVGKRSRDYAAGNPPPFLTVSAMEWIVEKGFRHLLVDFPSVDRMHDDGRLTNHHLFWKVPEGAHRATSDTHRDKTISEMIFADDSLVNGLYLLNLQVAAFQSDAAPSRPVLFPMERA